MKNKPTFSLPFEVHIAKRDGIPGWKRWMIRTEVPSAMPPPTP